MRTVFAIGAKEVKVYLCSPMSYIVAMVFLFATGVGFVGDLGDPFPEAAGSSSLVGDILIVG